MKKLICVAFISIYSTVNPAVASAEAAMTSIEIDLSSRLYKACSTIYASAVSLDKLKDKKTLEALILHEVSNDLNCLKLSEDTKSMSEALVKKYSALKDEERKIVQQLELDAKAHVETSKKMIKFYKNWHKR